MTVKDKPLLLWGLGAGIIALVAFIVGYAFVWPADGDDGRYRTTNDGNCGTTRDGGMMGGRGGMMGGRGGMMGGRGGMMGGQDGRMGDYGGCEIMEMMEGMMGEGGMMSGGISGMMSGGMGGMMNGPVDAATAPISIDQAADAARRYVIEQGNSDLKATRILEFTNGFYARVGEQGTGTGAYELWIDRNSGDVTRTTGPGMSWNKKYRSGMMDISGMMEMMQMMGGMESMMGEGGIGCTKGDNEDDEDDNSDDNGMDGMNHGDMDGMYNGNMSGMGRGNMGMDRGNKSGFGDISGMMGMTGSGSVNANATIADMTIKPADAAGRAQKFADVQFPGSRISNPDIFYGYYIVDIVKDGRVLTLLAVNGYSGQVWAQSWPGTYLGGKLL